MLSLENNLHLTQDQGIWYECITFVFGHQIAEEKLYIGVSDF